MMPEDESRAAARRRYTRSSSFQMALFFIVLCGAAVVILGYFGYYFYRGHFVYGTEAVIDAEMRHVMRYDSQAEIVAALDHEDRVFLLLDANNDKLAGNLVALPRAVSLLAEGTLVFALHEREYAAKIHTFPDGRRLLVGVDITAVSAEYRFMRGLSILTIAFMLLVIVTSYLISRFVVNNTNRIAATAKTIMDTGDLSQRIALTSRWDDLSSMASVLNEFLARIEHLMRGIRQVSDNIAHDLRTPLTRLRGHLEDLKAQKPVMKSKALTATCESLIAEADQILTTFNALLRIARIEAGRQHGAFAATDLKALVVDVLELYQPLAEEKEIALEAALSDTLLSCDRDLLFQAFANVLDNAVKFTPAGGRIAVALYEEGGHTIFVVTDSGPGIAADEKNRVFDRFYRAEQSRHTPGSGLGLSLVAAVIDVHGGRISLENAEPGLRVEIVL